MKWGKWVSALVCLLIILLVGSIASVMSIENWLKATLPAFNMPMSYADDRRPYEFTLQGTRFTVPRNYLTTNGLPPSGAKLDYVNMEVLWPGLEPHSRENHHEFTSVGWGRTIRLFVNGYGSLVSQSRLLEIRMKNADQTSCEKIRPGYKICQRRANSSSDEIHFIKTEGMTFAFECSIDGKYPSPSCTRRIYIAKDVNLKFSFSKKYVGDVQHIEDQLLALFESFKSPRN
jgi:hypothetical protein